MQLTPGMTLTVALVLLLPAWTQAADPAEPLLRNLPTGIYVDSSKEVPAAQTKAIGQKLGGTIRRLTNSVIRVHGRAIQVNVIVASDEANATAIQTALLKIKPFPFCLRNDAAVIEYVGGDIDVAIATKTSYELGLLEKPTSVQFRVTAELATVDKADYMACNPLFNQFLALQRGDNQQAVQQIQELSKKFTFGKTLTLRNPKLDGELTLHTMQPVASDSKEHGAGLAYSFRELPNRQGVPFVSITIDTKVDDTGFRADAMSPAESLRSATVFWPANDPAVVSLAKKITAGKATNDEKVMAILEWLTPGKNLKYSGQTGSRWGTLKVLEQRSGHCWDFSDCFVTLARAAGVPSRQVAGWLYGSSGHVWAEYYREGKGWQQVDPTGGGKLACGIYHIPYFTTEDGEMPILYLSMPTIDVSHPK
ncbi:MAG: transglutaminase-like domain-containing protein [Pirellulaceae bacterium]|nr:transglutaminase-like domain-containing protein [Pirellulaceae bacterium]